ncbi:GntR family transcriptional regulator [Corynebacterium striatum]|uniref:GntR family transcriptional regulator n=1 Tax=Corynebacterium striatum TaxID=43770 RepID=UPI000D756818|nr:GntR family transcriptional regulator [Corynebacterium striatum]PXY14743.1 transcriptional regulator [Corynebacterium striatum]PXY15810.1 transcriptional regulator [Corynebacterium striatum]
MTETTRRRPAYLTIADSLRSRIESKVLKPGERFPTERELVQEFGVARMTVRHALDILQIEGLIDRKRGRTGGTFVRAIPPTLSLTSEHGILQQLTERGFKTRVEVISLDKLEVLSHVAGTLGVEDTALVWELKGVHYVDETPISVTKVTIPVELVPDLDEHELNQPLLPLLETYGLKSVYKRENIIAATARAEEQKLLGVGRSHPMLRFSRIIKAADDTVIAFQEETLRSDVANVEVVLGEDPSLQKNPRTSTSASLS